MSYDDVLLDAADRHHSQVNQCANCDCKGEDLIQDLCHTCIIELIHERLESPEYLSFWRSLNADQRNAFLDMMFAYYESGGDLGGTPGVVL